MLIRWNLLIYYFLLNYLNLKTNVIIKFRITQLRIKARIILSFIYLVTKIIRPTIRVATAKVNDIIVHLERSPIMTYHFTYFTWSIPQVGHISTLSGKNSPQLMQCSSFGIILFFQFSFIKFIHSFS